MAALLRGAGSEERERDTTPWRSRTSCTASSRAKTGVSQRPCTAQHRGRPTAPTIQFGCSWNGMARGLRFTPRRSWPDCQASGDGDGYAEMGGDRRRDRRPSGALRHRGTSPGASTEADESQGTLLHRSRKRDSDPDFCRCLRDADGFRAAKLQHTIQRTGSDDYFGRLACILVRPQCVADHALIAADVRFHQSTPSIPGRFLLARLRGFAPLKSDFQPGASR